jgi:N-acetylglucosaminyldiphosphoundecaprenol N-acetyl-beta-D-mannosaminyltransferase
MLEVCERAAREGWRIYLYGGADGVAQALAERLAKSFPGLEVAGRQTPPFRPLDDDELEAALAEIRAARPHIVWVGLGCPKQEIWMLRNASRLSGCVTIGVGAAFDFHSGRIARAPRWMRDNGLEWLHRLASEPRRLWRRYLVLAPRFIVRAALQSARRRRVGASPS